MATTYTFLKTRLGMTRFARVTVSTIEADAWRVEWSDSAGALRRLYPSLEEALVRAAAACRARGGHSAAVRIEDIVETVSDTTPDAIECAAVLAAWAAWGCDGRDAVARFGEDGRWVIVFGRS